MSSGVETSLIFSSRDLIRSLPVRLPPVFSSMSRLPQPFHSRLRCASLEMRRTFMLVKIRLSVLSRLRNRRAMALQSFSIPQCADGEIQASKHATFVAETPLRDAVRRHYRRAPGDRDEEVVLE